MEKCLQKIGDVAEQYGVSTRTLRYYESVGLIKSIRNGKSQSRFYDSKAHEKLGQIIVLKQMGMTIDEILNIFKSYDSAVGTCRLKLQHLKKMERVIKWEKNNLNSFLNLLVKDGSSVERSISSLCRVMDKEVLDLLESSEHIEGSECIVKKKLKMKVLMAAYNPKDIMQDKACVV